MAIRNVELMQRQHSCMGTARMKYDNETEERSEYICKEVKADGLNYSSGLPSSQGSYAPEAVDENKPNLHQ